MMSLSLRARVHSFQMSNTLRLRALAVLWHRACQARWFKLDCGLTVVGRQSCQATATGTRLPIFARHFYTTVHHIATLVKSLSPPSPLACLPTHSGPPPLQSPLLAMPSKRGASAAARIAHLPSRESSTKHP